MQKPFTSDKKKVLKVRNFQGQLEVTRLDKELRMNSSYLWFKVFVQRKEAVLYVEGLVSEGGEGQ